MINYLTNANELTDVADAIREKGGTSAPLTYPTGFVSAIQAISGSSGGGTISYYTTTASIPASGWSDNTIIVNVVNMTADAAVIVAPLDVSAYEWAACGLTCVGQGTGTLTFSRTRATEHVLQVNLIVFTGGEYVEPPVTTKTVSVTLTNPVNSSYFQNCAIYTLLSGTLWDTDELLGTISSPTGNATVIVPAEIDYIQINFESSYPSASPWNTTCTGLIEVSTTQYESGCLMFSVQGDGTITVDSVDYYDD